MKVHEGRGDTAPQFLNSASYGGYWSQPRLLYPTGNSAQCSVNRRRLGGIPGSVSSPLCV